MVQLARYILAGSVYGELPIPCIHPDIGEEAVDADECLEFVVIQMVSDTEPDLRWKAVHGVLGERPGGNFLKLESAVTLESLL